MIKIRWSWHCLTFIPFLCYSWAPGDLVFILNLYILMWFSKWCPFFAKFWSDQCLQNLTGDKSTLVQVKTLPCFHCWAKSNHWNQCWPTLMTPCMGLLPDTQNRGLRMRRECRERFPRHRFQRKPLVSDPGIHHGTCVTHVPWCMSGLLNCGGGGKRSRHSRRMRNSQLYVSGKRPMASILRTRMSSDMPVGHKNPSSTGLTLDILKMASWA